MSYDAAFDRLMASNPDVAMVLAKRATGPAPDVCMFEERGRICGEPFRGSHHRHFGRCDESHLPTMFCHAFEERRA